MKKLLIIFVVGISCILSCTPTSQPTFTIRFISEQDTSFDGRLLLLISKSEEGEPRFQVRPDPKTQQVYGMNVNGWKSGETLTFDRKAFGYPLESLADLADGEYTVQALLHKYETFNRADGHTVKLPMDRGEGQRWNRAPGNLYSAPQKVSIKKGGTISISLDQEIPPIDPPEDSKYIKHVKIKSELLSDFWGRDMYLGAHILLPEGFDTHPEVRYPLAIMHGHFPYDFGGWRTEPADTTTDCVFADRFGMDCYNHIQEQEAYDFYKLWTGPNFPRVLAIKIQHANPYYDDSYAVNSENLGPYGDAIMEELVPYIEEQFRGIGEGWARFTYGGSTGGWEALAVQVKYPDEFSACYAACPDPIDFREYVTVNIYEDENAYRIQGDFRDIYRPERRDSLGHITVTMEDANKMELALGDHSRSGDQYDIWEAVYSPVGEDGYPKPIWDKYTGEIDPEVAAYWKENYDLTHIMQRDWEQLGPKLQKKVHIYCGDMDNYYLNNAVYLAEAFLENTSDPYYEGEVDYGDRDEHCWNGDHTQPNAISRLRYHRMFIPKWAEEIKFIAPAGKDLTSWRY
ncbi:MAG: alpha/beta hydrolase-fold protein [Bacteroidota bacterium]